MSRPAPIRAFLAGALTGLFLAASAAPAAAYSGSIILFDGPDGTGASLKAEGQVTNLGATGFNDKASSLYVAQGVWEVCADSNFKGKCQTYETGLHNLGGFSNQISSLRPLDASSDSGKGNGSKKKGGFVAFRDYNGEGEVLRVPNNVGDLNNVGFNDSISSIAIFEGRWQICENSFYGGKCLKFDAGTYNLTNFNDRASSVRRLGD